AASQVGVLRLEDDAHASPAELADQGVLADLGAFRQLRGRLGLLLRGERAQELLGADVLVPQEQLAQEHVGTEGFLLLEALLELGVGDVAARGGDFAQARVGARQILVAIEELPDVADRAGLRSGVRIGWLIRRRAHPRTIFSNSVMTSSSEVEYSRIRSRTISRRMARQRASRLRTSDSRSPSFAATSAYVRPSSSPLRKRLDSDGSP